MHKLLYVSNTRRSFPDAELNTILQTARRKNSELQITGLLLYADGGFLQVLEGQRNALYQLYDTIAHDARHWGAKLLLDQEAPRNFGGWTMGYQRLCEDDQNPALGEITHSAIAGLIKPGGAQPVLEILIRTFQAVQNVSD